MASHGDIRILRDLAKQYAEVAAKPVQEGRRALWRRHNALKRTRPMVLCLWWSGIKEMVGPMLECGDAFYRRHEEMLRRMLIQDCTGDDFVAEPWIALSASHVPPPQGMTPWGLPPAKRISPAEPFGAWKAMPPLQKLEDADRLVKPKHRIDEAATERNANRLREAIGDILDVNVDRTPMYTDIPNVLCSLRGIEQVMWDMHDNPRWLHRVLRLLSDAVLEANDEAEQNGDYRSCNHWTYPMPYEETLPDPEANGRSVTRRELFAPFHAQEYAQVSPAMHDEFMLQYQIPYMRKYGIVHYGCCEDLTNKIDILRKIPNLRRISAVPWADVARCAEQIADEYIISWQPNPAETVCCGFDPDKIRRMAKDAMDRMRGCHVEIVLKDVHTVQGDMSRLERWTTIMREVTEGY